MPDLKNKGSDEPLMEICETQSGFSRDLADFRTAMAQNQKVMQDILSQMAAFSLQQRSTGLEPSYHRSPEPSLRQSSHGVSYPTLRHKPAPVEFGRFNGDNADAWVFQAERYFEFYSISDSNKLSLASFYLDGEALDWYQWLYRNKQLIDWDHFAGKLLCRFKQRSL